ncbi:MAG: hypothetical protein ABSH36_07460 [Solirubrobacteraceae bacterium]
MTAVSSWGATAQERAMPMACDRLLAGTRVHRATTVDAPASMVFRWLCQLRLAPYSYDLVDNLGRRSPRELVPGVERLAVGQRFMVIFSLASFAYDEHITLRSHRVAVTYAVLCGEGPTRLVARVVFDPPGGRLGAALIGQPLALGDLIMMRKQLLTLKALAERDGTAQSAQPR